MQTDFLNISKSSQHVFDGNHKTTGFPLGMLLHLTV